MFIIIHYKAMMKMYNNILNLKTTVFLKNKTMKISLKLIEYKNIILNNLVNASTAMIKH